MAWFEMFISVLIAVIGSGGLWTFLQRKMERKDVKTKLLIGLAHDRIIYLGMGFIERKYITEDEYENLHDYLYLPYKAMGGNGAAERVMQEVSKLPIRKN